MKPLRAEHAEKRYWMRIGKTFQDPRPSMLRALFYPQRISKLTVEPVQISAGDYTFGGPAGGDLEIILSIMIRNDGPATANGITLRLIADRIAAAKLTAVAPEGRWGCGHPKYLGCPNLVYHDPVHPIDHTPPVRISFKVHASRVGCGDELIEYKVHGAPREFGGILFAADQDPDYLRLDLPHDEISAAVSPEIRHDAHPEFTLVQKEEFDAWRERLDEASGH